MQFFLEKERAGSGNAFSASWNGETLVAIANQTTFGNYVQYDFDVVGADGASTLQFNFVSGATSYWFLDDVSVTPAYTPGVELRSGRIGFADADLTDSHTVTVTAGYQRLCRQLHLDADQLDGHRRRPDQLEFQRQ